jgi:hypothetical protein
MSRFRKTLYGGVVSAVVLLGVAGCTQEQLAKIDKGVTDANEIAAGIGGLGTGPTGALMPGWVQSTLAAIGIVGGLALVTWQQLRNSGLLEKLATLTSTSKAIVRGVDEAAKANPDAVAKVKAEILTEMQRKGIELEARQTVRDLKAA